MMQLPAILDIPKKLLPFITDFNNFRFFLLHGGRGGGKTWAIARFLLYLAEKNRVRIVCGREIQSSIKDSVYTVFVDTIEAFQLKGFTVKADSIIHVNGSEIKFKGFREQGIVSAKGLEGVDILWIDEAQSITKGTLKIVMPTIRKKNSRVIFSMNRDKTNDPVYVDYSTDDDCLTIKINYYENPNCPKELKDQALKCKEKNPDEYDEVWEGNPRAQGTNSIFSRRDLDKCKQVQFFGDTSVKGRVLSVDVAGGSEDSDTNVATIIDCLSPTKFNTSNKEFWHGKNTMQTTGQIVELVRKYNPNLVVVDATGIGEGVYDRLLEMNVNVIDFKGARKSENMEAYNTRAEAYLKARDLVEMGYIKLDDEKIIDDLEVMTYKVQSNGTKMITKKSEIKKIIGRSPDDADSWTMGCWALDKIDYSSHNEDYQDYYC